MEKNPNNSLDHIQLPPGFRFHPSDEELVMHYLINKATLRALPANIIAEVDLYKFNPWELPNKAIFGEEEWYFFTPRDRKYPNGRRPNRMAVSGYWKATGTDKPIFNTNTSCGVGKIIGLKKALVFYKGKPPKGSKTDWIMHEYRLPQTIWNSKKKWSIRLDDWVLCKVWRKPCSIFDHKNEPKQIYSNVGKSYYTHTNSLITKSIENDLPKDSQMLPFIFEETKTPASSISEEGKSEVDDSPYWSSLLKQIEGNNNMEQDLANIGEDNINSIGLFSSSSTNIEQMELQNFVVNYWDPMLPS